MPAHATLPARGRPSAGPLRGLHRLAARALGHVLRWHELARERRALLALDERMLKDIGITRLEAEREASRPFWSDRIDPWQMSRD